MKEPMADSKTVVRKKDRQQENDRKIENVGNKGKKQ